MLSILLLASVGLCLAWLSSGGNVPPVRAAQPPLTCHDLVQNGSFENDSAWRTESAGGYDLISDANAHSGRRALYLGGSNYASDNAWQVITAPVGSTFYLDYWWQVTTWEHFPAHDWLTVSLQTTTGAPLTVIASYNDGDHTFQWQHAAFTLTGKLPPGPLWLHFRAVTNDTNPTDFYVDDVRLLACQTDLPLHSYFPVVNR